MADVHDTKTRSYNMSKIKGKDTKPEMIVRKFLHSQGFRYKLHDKRLPGKPDLVLPKYNTVIFIQGCFWHGHQDCKYYKIPKTRTDWWLTKITTNKSNDSKHQALLISMGWNIIEIWECGLKPKQLEATLKDLVDMIFSNSPV
jgi:DNA mismatch endonuclease (patch repair protein)